MAFWLTLLMSNLLAEHARANLPGFAAPLLVDESVGCTVWDSGTSRSSGEPVELRTIGPSKGCWEGGGSCEERGDCTPASSPFASIPPFASEAAPAADAGSAAMRVCMLQRVGGSRCWLTSAATRLFRSSRVRFRVRHLATF